MLDVWSLFKIANLIYKYLAFKFMIYQFYSSSKSNKHQATKREQSLILVLQVADEDEHGLNQVLFTEIHCHSVLEIQTRCELDWLRGNLSLHIQLLKEQPHLFMTSPALLTVSINKNRGSSTIGKPVLAIGCSYHKFQTKYFIYICCLTFTDH